MPLITESELYYHAIRLGPAPLGTPEPGPTAPAPIGELPEQALWPALNQAGTWLNRQFRPHVNVLIGVARSGNVESGLYIPGETEPLPGSAALLDGMRAAGSPVSLLWFGDVAAAGADFGSLLLRVGWGAQTVLAALVAAGYQAALDPRAGLVRRMDGMGEHLAGLRIAAPANAAPTKTTTEQTKAES